MQHFERDVTALLHVERFVHPPHATVGDHTPHLIAIAQKLPDARILAVREHRDLRRAGELDAVDRAKAGVVRVQPTASWTGFHAGRGAFGESLLLRLTLAIK